LKLNKNQALYTLPLRFTLQHTGDCIMQEGRRIHLNFEGRSFIMKDS